MEQPLSMDDKVKVFTDMGHMRRGVVLQVFWFGPLKVWVYQIEDSENKKKYIVTEGYVARVS